MKAAVDESICVFGSGVILRHITALRAEIDGVRQAQDIEYIHRMRVASRRLRTALPLFRACTSAKKLDAWEKDIRAITRALGAARDADVQLDLLARVTRQAAQSAYRSGLRRLALRLRQRRERLQGRVLAALDTLEADQTLAQMESTLAVFASREGQVYIFTPELYRLAFQSITAALDHFLSYSEIVAQPEEVEKLHEMRIAAKHMRYTLETFAPLYPDELKRYINTARKAQDALGEIHDCDVWRLYLPEFITKETARIFRFYGSERPARRLLPGLSYFETDRADLRAATYAKFVEDWQNWQGDNLWDGLRKTISLPFFQLERVTPNPRRSGPAPAGEATG